MKHPYVFFISPDVLQLALRNVANAHEHATTLVALSREHGFAQYEAVGTLIQAGVLIAQQQVEIGVSQMRQGIDASRATGTECGLTPWLLWLAIGYGKLGQQTEGLTVVNETITSAERRGEDLFIAELYRVKGELLRRQEQLCLHEANSLLQNCFKPSTKQPPVPKLQQDASKRRKRNYLALGPVTSNCGVAHRSQSERLWQSQGKTIKPDTCPDILPWFANEVDIEDLREAKSLLASPE